MGDVTRNIGLSLGADICWPLCYEHMMRKLDLRIPLTAIGGGGGDGDSVKFHVERVSIEPFDLKQPVKYDVVIDRLTPVERPGQREAHLVLRDDGARDAYP